MRHPAPSQAATKVPVEYVDCANMFSTDLASKLPEHTGINNHAIELVNSQQPPHETIYSLRSVDPEGLY